MKHGKTCAAALMLAAIPFGLVPTARAQSCPTVDIDSELMIRDVNVVEDAARTQGDGVWTFKHLMESMAPSAAEAPGMVEAMFSTWLTDQNINGLTVPARPDVGGLVLDAWPRASDGQLDLSQAPVRLLAIVNRLDQRSLAKGQAGEGRFVFGVLDSSGASSQFTLILEYRLPAANEADVLDWANQWHGLNGLTRGSADYNAALEAITERFAGRNADANGVNGSALNQLRTNELAIAIRDWELREFTLSGDGSLQPATVKLTPDLSFRGTELAAEFVNQNESDILRERHDVPETFGGAPFLAGSAITPFRMFWPGDGVTNNEARHKFSLNTCNGCHAGETDTLFLHVAPREPGQEAGLSGFLLGEKVTDPVDGTEREFSDLARRRDDMSAVLCTSGGGGLVERGEEGTVSLSEGIGRVH